MKKKCKCATCKHRWELKFKDEYWSCNYFMDTGELRGCEAGNKCTKYEEGDTPERNEPVVLEGSTPNRKEKDDYERYYFQHHRPYRKDSE